MAGWSRIRVFSPLGVQLAEIDAPTKRSWVLNGVGRCTFTMPVYSDQGGFYPKTTPALLKYGNLILIEHAASQNYDGTFNGTLPPWVGVILPPQPWQYGKVNITAYSAEQLLFYRPMPLIQRPAMSQGAFFADILQLANSIKGVLPIQLGSINYVGGAVSRIYANSALEEINTMLGKAKNMAYDVTPNLDANGNLTLFGNWYRPKGVNTGVILSNVNTQNTSPLYTEQGVFYNTVIGYSDSYSDGVRVTGTSVDVEGVAANGVLAVNVYLQGTDGAAADVVQKMTDNWLAANKAPIKTLAPTLLDVGNAFSYAVTGNKFAVQLDTVGFSDGGIGLNGTAQIIANEYDDLLNTCKLAVMFS